MELREIPALGRPFELGLLYDCRKNNLVTHPRIWNKRIIETHSVMQPQPLCEYEFTAEDTLSAKSSFLNVNADLKLSVLLGLFEVHGSAKYLENRRKFTRQSRLSFKYSCRTHYKELHTQEIISELQINPKEINQTTATHVVTGILYGIDTIFVFDRTATFEEDQLEVSKNLEKIMSFLPKIMNGQSSDRKKSNPFESVTCTYHGDLQLGPKPSSFEEAIKVLKTLPAKIKQNVENSIPILVWLYTLSKLTNKKPTLIRSLDEIIVNQIQDKFEKFHVLKMKCNDLLNSPTCKYDKSYEFFVIAMQADIVDGEKRFRSELIKHVKAGSSADLVKRNVGKTLVQFETLLSKRKHFTEITRLVNVFDTCVRKIQSTNKDDQSNTRQDIKCQLSRDNKRLELPHPLKMLKHIDKKSSTDSDMLRRNIFSERKRLKEDMDMIISKSSTTEKNLMEEIKTDRGKDQDFQRPLMQLKLAVKQTRFESSTRLEFLDPPIQFDEYNLLYRGVDDESWNICEFLPSESSIEIPNCKSGTVFRVTCSCGRVSEIFSQIPDIFEIEHCLRCESMDESDESDEFDDKQELENESDYPTISYMLDDGSVWYN